MSGKTTGKVWDLKLTPAKKTVLLAMADHANHEDSGIKPGIPLIAWKTDYSERQVQRIVHELEEDGILVAVKTEFSKPTEYRIDFSKGETKEPFVPRKKNTKKPETDDQKGDKMSPRQDVMVTSHESEEKLDGDIASPDLSSIRHKEEPSLEHNFEPESSSKDVEVPSPQPAQHSHKEKSAMIYAWWESLPSKPATVDPTSIYRRKVYFAYAENMLNLGVTPDGIKAFVKRQTDEGGFYHDKALDFTRVAKQAPSWCAAHKEEIARLSVTMIEIVPKKNVDGGHLDGIKFVS